MSTDHNRLLLQIEQSMRAINRQTIDPVLPKLSLDDLNPVITVVAESRARYLRELFNVSQMASTDGVPSTDQVARLRDLRTTYEELVAGAQALETAIERGYLQVLTTE